MGRRRSSPRIRGGVIPVRIRSAMSVLFLGSLKDLFRPGPKARRVGPAEARRLQTQGALILDVRELHEWRSGHAPGAKHLPLGEVERKLGELPRDRTIVVTCASGMRSRSAAKKLLAAGFTDVVDVQGGMGAWRAEGFPVQR